MDLCQSKWIGTGLAELSPILEQSNANFVPFTRAIPALNQGTSPLWRLVSSPLGGQIQGKRAFPILTNPFKCWPAYANPGQPNCQSLANPWPLTFLTIEQVVYMGWSSVYSENEFEVTSIANHNQFRPITTSSGRSMPILANPTPIRCQPFTPTNNTSFPIPILYNSVQSMPSWDNQMSIPDQSHTNPGPIIFQSGANQMPIQGHSLDQSRIIRSIFLPIQANPILIQCRSDANPRSIFYESLPILANPCQS